MAVKLRLTRLGKKKNPIYRLVAMEGSFPRDGRYQEMLAQYDPKKGPHLTALNEERVKHWLSVGAQPTETVHRLLAELGLVEKIVRHSKFSGISRKQRKSKES